MTRQRKEFSYDEAMEQLNKKRDYCKERSARLYKDSEEFRNLHSKSSAEYYQRNREKYKQYYQTCKEKRFADKAAANALLPKEEVPAKIEVPAKVVKIKVPKTPKTPKIIQVPIDPNEPVVIIKTKSLIKSGKPTLSNILQSNNALVVSFV